MPSLTPEQLEERRTFIGASDISAIVGVNPFKDAFDVLNEKLGFSAEAPEEENEATDWGHRLEPVIRAWYVATTDSKVQPCGTVRHPEHTWAAATLDSKIVGTRRGLEIKAVGHRMVYDWDTSDDEGIPHYVRCQTAWQMWCVGLEEIDVASLLGGTIARVWRIKRDQELERILVQQGRVFWEEHVVKRVAPTLTASDGARAYLDAIFPPQPMPVPADADEKIVEIVQRRASAHTLRKMNEDRFTIATAEAIAWLGEHGATDVKTEFFDFRYRLRKDGTRQPYCKMKGDKL